MAAIIAILRHFVWVSSLPLRSLLRGRVHDGSVRHEIPTGRLLFGPEGRFNGLWTEIALNLWHLSGHLLRLRQASLSASTTKPTISSCHLAGLSFMNFS